MAIKVIESISINRTGFSSSNLILTLQSTCRLTYSIVNNARVYVVSGNLYYYIDRTKEPIHTEYVSFTINESQMDSNLVEYMYSMIKSRYTNYEDLL